MFRKVQNEIASLVRYYILNSSIYVFRLETRLEPESRVSAIADTNYDSYVTNHWIIATKYLQNYHINDGNK